MSLALLPDATRLVHAIPHSRSAFSEKNDQHKSNLARVAWGQGVVQGALVGVVWEGGVEGASGPATPLFITLHRCTPEVSSAQQCFSLAECQGEARCILSTASSRPSPHPRQCVPCLHHLLEHHNPPDMSLGCSACTIAYVFLAHEKQKLPANAAIFPPKYLDHNHHRYYHHYHHLYYR